MDYYVYTAIALFCAIIYVIIKQRSSEKELKQNLEELNQNINKEIENAVLKTFQNSTGVLENAFVSAMSRNTDIIKGAFATSLKELGVQEDVSSLKNTSTDLKQLANELKTMFEIKQARAKYGELQLENLLRDIFPPQKISFQKSIPGLGIPDACVLVKDKYLCIDSKFPLENFKKSGNNGGDEKYWKKFVADVGKHVENVRKYVGRENTMDFAFMYVPSDTIYYQLACESPETIVDASKNGVILTSPSVLPAYLNLVSAGMRAEEISEKAEKIQKKIDNLARHIDNLEKEMGKTNRHLNNAYTSMSRTTQSFSNLKSYFNSVCDPEFETNAEAEDYYS